MCVCVCARARARVCMCVVWFSVYDGSGDRGGAAGGDGSDARERANK